MNNTDYLIAESSEKTIEKKKEHEWTHYDDSLYHPVDDYHDDFNDDAFSVF